MDRERLITLLASGQESAWRIFLADYGKLIYSISSRFMMSETEKEDHFQGVCLSILRSLSKLRDPERLASWIYNIAYRLAIDMLRRRKVRGTSILPESSDSPALAVEPGILEDLEHLQTAALLKDALALLDESCRLLLDALFLADPRPSYAEISRVQEIPIGSIGPTRARCLEKLGKFYTDLSNEAPLASTADEAPGSQDGSGNPHEGREKS